MSSVVPSRALSSPAVVSSGWWEFPAGALLSVIAIVALGADARTLPLIYLAAVTPTLCAIDAAERRLPNRLVLPGYLVAAAGILAHWIVTREVALVALVSGAAYFVFMLAFGVAGGMGMGDVKLAGVLGLCAGLLGPTAAIVSPVAAFVLGGVAALAALRGGRGASIPFGPFMLAGFWIAVVVGG